MKAIKKVVVAKWTLETYFEVPSDIDLDDKGQVELWYVKWNILHIKKTDGTTLEIESSNGCDDNFDWKHPDEEEVKNRDDTWLEDEDSDEEAENGL